MPSEEQEPRRCMWIDPAQSRWNPRLETDGYIPSLVTEGEAGHSPLKGATPDTEPWFWGDTLEKAQATAESYNRRTFGIEPLEAALIVASSMAAGRPERVA